MQRTVSPMRVWGAGKQEHRAEARCHTKGDGAMAKVAKAVQAAAEALALSKIPAEKGARDLVRPGMYAVDVTVRVKGLVTVAPDGTRAPTASIPLLPVLALLLKRMGATREKAIEIVREVARQALEAGEKVGAAVEEQELIGNALQQIQQEIVAGLPTVPVKGAVKATLTVERL